MDILLPDALPSNVRHAIDVGNQRTVCPKCDGGRSREFSLSVRQDETGVIKLKCWRASCGWFALSMSDPDARLQTKRLKPPSVYRDEILPLIGNIHEFIARTYRCSSTNYPPDDGNGCFSYA